jgi:uncharacterized protein YjbI with pentapeptide repeats
MPSWSTWSVARQLLVVVAVVLVSLAVAVGLLWPLTDVIAAHDVGLITGPLRAAHLQTAREAVRTQLLTLGAGVFAAGALIFTARNSALSRRAVELTRQTLELTEQGQVTDRYTKAIEQLGSDKLDIRIGGIYALERIARDSARDHPTVIEVLQAFIREHSREQWPPLEASIEAPERSTRPDVQAGMTVIGHRDTTRDGGQIDLRGADLTKADLSGAELSGANLRWTNLTRVFAAHANLAAAHFRGANLAEIDFSGANLRGASFTSAHLSDAFMPGADLVGAHFQRADLSRANLTLTVLSEAYLHGVNLTGANLLKADLTGADLTDANMRHANLVDVNLTGADLANADLSTANLAGTIFTDAKLARAWLSADATIPAGWAVDPSTGRLARIGTDPSNSAQCGS